MLDFAALWVSKGVAGFMRAREGASKGVAGFKVAHVLLSGSAMGITGPGVAQSCARRACRPHGILQLALRGDMPLALWGSNSG